jgi:NAD(P)-dependent dehydrogenase (short-subunit alcohol dehydrogenase family)
MQNLRGKTAFVTGGASGIGLALGQAFAQAGIRVMLADIETDALAKAVEKMRGFGSDVRGLACDVSDPVAVEYAAKETYASFGNVHVVCNNAGVAGGSGIDDISLDTWRWVLDVNVMGVLHGVRTFLPHIRSHGEGGHFVNTAFDGRAEHEPVLREQIRGGQHLGRARETDCPTWNRRHYRLSRIRANPYLGQRAQQTTTLW